MLLCFVLHSLALGLFISYNSFIKKLRGPSMIGRSINVFLASPTGLEIERQYAREVSSHINRTIGSKLGIQLNLLSWETSFYSDIDTDGQAVIKNQLKKD